MDSQHWTVTIAFAAIRKGGQAMRNSRRQFLKLLVTTGAAGGLSGRVFADAARAPSRGEVLELTELASMIEHYADANSAVRSFL